MREHRESRRFYLDLYPTLTGWCVRKMRRFGGKYVTIEWRKYFYGNRAEDRARNVYFHEGL